MKILQKTQVLGNNLSMRAPKCTTSSFKNVQHSIHGFFAWNFWQICVQEAVLLKKKHCDEQSCAPGLVVVKLEMPTIIFAAEPDYGIAASPVLPQIQYFSTTKQCAFFLCGRNPQSQSWSPKIQYAYSSEQASGLQFVFAFMFVVGLLKSVLIDIVW